MDSASLLFSHKQKDYRNFNTFKQLDMYLCLENIKHK